MCMTCGCGDENFQVHGQPHLHTEDHHHGDSAGSPSSRIVEIERDLLSKNDGFASANRKRFAAKGCFVLNLMSSPGSGKTTLLVETIRRLQGHLPVSVIEGDQQTSQDAERIRATGVPALQINTGKGCHLDAHMIAHALEKMPVPENGLLLIENVGNLVCPAEFDLGESSKVVVLSTTEGEDKPIKYPDMFAAASLMVLNKCDLLPYLDFNVEAAIAYARQVNPALQIISLSARTGEGMQAWLDWINNGVAEARAGNNRGAFSYLGKGGKTEYCKA
jgi:hydrogenase nickel incorporation protein HypB